MASGPFLCARSKLGLLSSRYPAGTVLSPNLACFSLGLSRRDKPKPQVRKVGDMYAVERADGLVIALRREYNDAIAIQAQLSAEGIKTSVRKVYGR